MALAVRQSICRIRSRADGRPACRGISRLRGRCCRARNGCVLKSVKTDGAISGCRGIIASPRNTTHAHRCRAKAHTAKRIQRIANPRRRVSIRPVVQIRNRMCRRVRTIANQIFRKRHRSRLTRMVRRKNHAADLIERQPAQCQPARSRRRNQRHACLMHLDAQRVRAVHQRRCRQRQILKTRVPDFVRSAGCRCHRARRHALPYDFRAVEINHRAIIRQRSQRELHLRWRAGKRELLLKVISPRGMRGRGRQHSAHRRREHHIFKRQHAISRKPSARSRRVRSRRPSAREPRAGAVIKPRIAKPEHRLRRTQRRIEIPRPRSPAARHRCHPVFRQNARQMTRPPRNREPAAIRAERPRAAIVVAQLIHHAPSAVAQADGFAAVVQRARPRPQRGDAGHRPGIRRHHEIPARSDHRCIWKSEIHSAGNLPS